MHLSFALILTGLMVAPTMALSMSARANSGSALTAFTDDNCENGWFTITDVAHDGVQGTDCFNSWLVRQDNGAIYRTVDSFTTANLQGGCVAHIYSGFDCQNEVYSVDAQSDGNCYHNYGQWFGLSAKITC